MPGSWERASSAQGLVRLIPWRSLPRGVGVAGVPPVQIFPGDGISALLHAFEEQRAVFQRMSVVGLEGITVKVEDSGGFGVGAGFHLVVPVGLHAVGEPFLCLIVSICLSNE